MSQIEPAKRWSARHARRLLLVASASALLASSPAPAQEIDELRSVSSQEGEQSDAGLWTEETGFRTTYVTQSPGPSFAEEEAATDGLFGGPVDDPFIAAPLPSARPQENRQTSTWPQAAEPQETEATGTVRAQSAERAGAAEPQNQRVQAIETRSRAPEEGPYAPLGLRLGTFLVTSSLEQGITWTSNATSSPDGESAVLSETTLRLNALSDWSRHAAALSAYGTFRETLSGEEVSDPEGGFDGNLVLDLGGDFRATASAAYDLRRESAASPVDLPPVTFRPLRHTMTGSVGLEKALGKLGLGISGNVERQQFGDAELEGGGDLSQRDRDFVLTTAVLRAGYEISPALTPFVEAELGRRAYDLSRDANGYDRSATRTGARAGLAFDLGEKLFGEVSAGWVGEDIDDPRLTSLSAATVSADIFWSPMRGTLVGLQAATIVEGTTTPDSSGSVLYIGRLSVERELRANLTGYTALGAEWRDYPGEDDRYELTLAAEAGMTYWFNRYAGLTGRARHERFTSDQSASDSETSSVFLGVKLQR